MSTITVEVGDIVVTLPTYLVIEKVLASLTKVSAQSCWKVGDLVPEQGGVYAGVAYGCGKHYHIFAGQADDQWQSMFREVLYQPIFGALVNLSTHNGFDNTVRLINLQSPVGLELQRYNGVALARPVAIPIDFGD